MTSALTGVAVTATLAALPTAASAETGGTVQGTVVDTAGTAVSGALAAVFAPGASEPAFTATADADGRFAVTLPAGQWVVCVGKQDVNEDYGWTVDLFHPTCEPGDPFGDQRAVHDVEDGSSTTLAFTAASRDRSLTRVVRPASATWVRADVDGKRRYRAVAEAVLDVRAVNTLEDTPQTFYLGKETAAYLLNKYSGQRKREGLSATYPAVQPHEGWEAWTVAPLRVTVRGATQRHGHCMRSVSFSDVDLPQLYKVTKMRVVLKVNTSEELLYDAKVPVAESPCYGRVRLSANGVRYGRTATSPNSVREVSFSALSDRPYYAIGASVLKVYWQGRLWRTLDAREMRDPIRMPRTFRKNRTRFKLVFVGDDPRYPRRVVKRTVRFPYGYCLGSPGTTYCS